MKWTAMPLAVVGLVLPASAVAGTGSLQDQVYRYTATPGEANVLQQVRGGTQQIGILDTHLASGNGAGCVAGLLPDTGEATPPSPLPADEPVADGTPVEPLPRPTPPLPVPVPVPVPPIVPPVELPTARAAGVGAAGNAVSCAPGGGRAILESRFDLGDLDDRLTINAGAERVLAVDAGTGDDHLDVIYAAQQLVVTGGEGNDSIAIDGSRSGPAAIDCGPGVDDVVGAPAGAQTTGCERVNGRGRVPLTIGHVDAVGSLVEVVVYAPGSGTLVLSDSAKLLRRERVGSTRAQAYVYGLETARRATNGATTTIRARFRTSRGRVTRASKTVTLVNP